jgi:hypothetical protein
MELKAQTIQMLSDDNMEQYNNLPYDLNILIIETVDNNERYAQSPQNLPPALD